MALVPYPAYALLLSITLTTAASILDKADRAVPDYVTHYAPLVWLHSEDPFRPADLLQHVRHTTPMVAFQSLSGLPELDLDNLAALNEVDGGPVALTANDDITTLPAWLFGETPDESGRLQNATSCVVILVEKNEQDVDAFYFYFYSYDRGANISQVLPPLNGLLKDTEHGVHFGNHVGDWEHNMVRFRDGKPMGIYYSQHSDGSAYGWSDAALSVQSDRPIAYSAYGSHANYVASGEFVHDAALLDYCDAGKLWDPVSSAYFYHFDPVTSSLTRLLPPGSASIPTSNLTSYLYFEGIWGDFQWPDEHPGQKTVKYFGLKRYTSGPTGPLTKQLVRKGLFPDKPSRKSWLQWGVGVFMSLYPCCFRGWRAWVSGVVFIGILVALVLSTKFGIKYALRWFRSRTKGYKKVDTDIPLEDVGYRDDYSPAQREPDRK